jgi:hypothetical protein
MRGYIKIIGPPVLKAIKELEKLAIDMPQVCVMDEAILRDIPRSLARDIGEPIEYRESVMGFFSRRTGVRVRTERCNDIISKSTRALGEFDFFFEWFENPRTEQLNYLIKEIDKVLGPLGCYYTITTK